MLNPPPPSPFPLSLLDFCRLQVFKVSDVASYCARLQPVVANLESLALPDVIHAVVEATNKVRDKKKGWILWGGIVLQLQWCARDGCVCVSVYVCVC